MNENFRQRLVGALILLALGVIFWPIIFVQPGDDTTAELGAIPPRPDVSTEPLPTPETDGMRGPEPVAARQQSRVDEASQAPSAQSPAGTRAQGAGAQPLEPEAREADGMGVDRSLEQGARVSAPEPLELDSDGVPVAWILQVASVSSRDKALALRSRLLEMDHKAYVESVDADGRELHRVYIGPKFEKAKLATLRDEIDAEFGVTSMIRRYVP
ncbi:MAG: SPOR domain-containing protein [Halioglobus sp.]|nr:SPOR domain-containing protein [Halioglobus sp.]